MSTLPLLLSEFVEVPRLTHKAPFCPHGVAFVEDTLASHPHELALGLANVEVGKSGAPPTIASSARKAAGRLARWLHAVSAFIKHAAPSAKVEGSRLLLATLRGADAGTVVAHASQLTLLTRILVKPSAPLAARATGADCLALLLAIGCGSSAQARAAVLACVDKGLVTSVLTALSNVAPAEALPEGVDAAVAVATAMASCGALEVMIEVAPTLMRAHAGRVERACLALFDHEDDALASRAVRLLTSVRFLLGDGSKVASLLTSALRSAQELVALAMPQLLAGRGTRVFDDAHGGAGNGGGDGSVLGLPQLECDERAVLRRFTRLTQLVSAVLNPATPSPHLVAVPTTEVLTLVEVVLDTPFMSSSKGHVRVRAVAPRLLAVALTSLRVCLFDLHRASRMTVLLCQLRVWTLSCLDCTPRCCRCCLGLHGCCKPACYPSHAKCLASSSTPSASPLAIPRSSSASVPTALASSIRCGVPQRWPP